MTIAPKWVDLNTEDGKKSYYGSSHYNKILEFAKNKGIEDNIVFHPWIPFDMMPQYYSLGKLTLCIGRFIEAFGGNSSIESVLCGTPVIISRVGAQRTTLPEEIVDKIDVGDANEIEKKALEILKNGKDLSAAQKFIRENYDFQRMLEDYERVIIDTKPLSAISPTFKKVELNPSIKLAPWCYITKDERVYNDYLYGYFNINDEIIKILKLRGQFFIKELSSKSLVEEVENLVNEGILVYEHSNSK